MQIMIGAIVNCHGKVVNHREPQRTFEITGQCRRHGLFDENPGRTEIGLNDGGFSAHKATTVERKESRRSTRIGRPEQEPLRP